MHALGPGVPAALQLPPVDLPSRIDRLCPPALIPGRIQPEERGRACQAGLEAGGGRSETKIGEAVIEGEVPL